MDVGPTCRHFVAEGDMIHGRRRVSESRGVFTGLTQKVRERWFEILSERGPVLEGSWKSFQKPAELHPLPDWPDDALRDPSQDVLDLDAFARFLTKRIAAVPPELGAHTAHIYGPWGAGK